MGARRHAGLRHYCRIGGRSEPGNVARWVVESAPVPSLFRRAGARLNVLFLTRSLDLGGAERQLATLAPALARRGHAGEVA